jgi:N-acetylneuraminic acid mutarotase
MTLLRVFLAWLLLGGATLPALELPDLPDPRGRAGMMAAVILDDDGREAILAAGGANFPGKPPWEGGRKVFHRDIFLCRRDAAGKWGWTKVGDLPTPIAYAAFCATPDRRALVVAGGADADRHLAAVWKVGADGRCEKFADALPQPRAYAGFVEVNGALALLGGSDAPDATAALGTLASLRLDRPQAGWRLSAEEAAQARILPLFGADETTLLWGGGCQLFDQGGKAARAYQADLHHANSRLQGADFHGLPGPLAAPAGPGVLAGTGLFFVGGDDGAHYGKPPAEHPGQSRDILYIDLETREPKVVGQWPTPLATAPLLRLGHDLVTISGETRPGVRTPACSSWTIPAKLR